MAMKNMTLQNIAKACGGAYYGSDAEKDCIVESIVTDSRQVEKGSLFVAIPGERDDGHCFIPAVYEKGALAVLSQRRLDKPQGPYILVDSTLEAVKWIAAFYRRQLPVKVVGITGSVGKTSTKEIIAASLSEKYNVLKTQGNFNNELGVPLTVFRLREEHEIAVLEMGINHFGEMHRLSRIVAPDVCVITNIGQCHLEFLGDRAGVLRAKSEIFDYMAEDGKIILNGDDDLLAQIREVKGIRPIFFGIDDERAVYADEIESCGLHGIRCTIHADGEAVSVQVPIPGIHMVRDALAAAAVGRAFGLTLEEIKNGIEKLQPVTGRFRLIEREHLTIIDDCHNANPASMKASLDVLKDAAGRRVAILGDMGELGTDKAAMHAEVGRYAAQGRTDLLVCVGDASAEMASAARETGDCAVIYVTDLEEALGRLPEILCEGDTVLVKASHFMHFERIVERLSV